MNLVDEEHIVLLQGGEDAGQVARLVKHGTAGNLESHPQFVGDDVAECGLAQSRRAVQQGMVERFTAVFGGLYKDLQVLHHLPLSAEIPELQWSQGILILFL